MTPLRHVSPGYPIATLALRLSLLAQIRRPPIRGPPTGYSRHVATPIIRINYLALRGYWHCGSQHRIYPLLQLTKPLTQ
jgi:hypothetical protein